MARKCGACRQEGHTRVTCPDLKAGIAEEKAGPPPSRTCACGEITTMGPFPGMHEAAECGGQSGPNVLVDRHGDPAYPEEPDPFSSPTHTHHYVWADDDNGHSGSFCTCGQEEPEPTGDHRKWCTRCKLLGHYSADCTTPVLDGGVVSVPEPAPATHTGQPAQHTSPYIAALAAEVGKQCLHLNGFSVNGCAGCGESEPEGQDCPGCGHWTYSDSGRCDDCTLEMAEVRRNEPDPFTTPTQVPEELNVSGQPKSRYEWYGKQNRGYLVKLPETGDFRRYKNGKPKGLTRATTFNKAATDQNALADWKARNVLIGASKRPDLVAKAHGLTHEDNRDQLMKLVAELETTAGAKVSADVGTLIHELTERWDAGLVRSGDIPAQYGDLIYLYDKTLKAAGLWPVPGLIERTTYIPQFGGVVGTLDRVYYHEASGQYVIGDVKTGKTLKYGMDEIETQEWIYAHGVNNAGVYDWNTGTWEVPEMAVTAHHGAKSDRLTVSEEWGVVVHMPVQGDDAGKVMLVRADLQRGKRHAQVCHDVRVQRANKPKPELWTGEELKAPESVSGTDWDMEFSEVLSREDAAAVWQTAYDRGVPPEEMDRLKVLADARLAELAAPVATVEQLREDAFRCVTDVAHAGRLWEEARKAGVEPMELNRLVSLAQQRLRELGISG